MNLESGIKLSVQCWAYTKFSRKLPACHLNSGPPYPNFESKSFPPKQHFEEELPTLGKGVEISHWLLDLSQV